MTANYRDLPTSPTLMNRNILLASLAALVMAISAPRSSAVLIASEQFSYAAANNSTLGSGGGLNGGTGWSNAWAGTFYFQTNGMSYLDLSVAGGSSASRTFSSTDNFRGLSTNGMGSLLTPSGKFGLDGTDIWVRFLAGPMDANFPVASFVGLSLFDNSTEVLFMGKRQNSPNWGLQHSGILTNSGTSVSSSGSTLIITKISFAAGNESVNMWALTNSLPAGTNALGTPTLSVSTTTSFEFNRIRLGSGTNSSDSSLFRFDEIFVANDFDSLAIPEPSTVGLLGLAAAAAIGYSVRRRLRR